MVAFLIISCSEDLTSPGALDVAPPVFFGEGNDNQINLVYGNDGRNNALIHGRVNTGFHFTSTNAAFRFSQVVVPGSDSTSDSTSSLTEAGGIVLNPLSSTIGLSDVDKVSDGSQAAYRFIPPPDAGVGAIAVNNLTPVSSSVITLRAVFTNIADVVNITNFTDGTSSTNAANLVLTKSFDFDVEVNVTPYPIANLGITDQALANALQSGGNFLNRTTTNTNGMVTLNYSGLADFVNGLIEPSSYPQSPVAKPFEIGLDFGIRLSIDGQTALADGSGYRFTGLSPTQLNDYRLAFTLTSLGNFTGSAGVVGGLNINRSQESLRGYLAYDITESIDLRQTVSFLPVTNSNGFDPGTGVLSYSIVSPAVNGISLSDSSTGELTVNASTVGVTNHQVEVQVVSSHGGQSRATFELTVVEAITGSITYDNVNLATNTVGQAVVNLDDLNPGSGVLTYEITNRVAAGLPQDLTINPDTGEISLPGTLSAGAYPIGVQVTSTHGGEARAPLMLQVREPIRGEMFYAGGNIQDLNVNDTTKTIFLDADRTELGSDRSSLTYSIVSGAISGTIDIDSDTGDLQLNPNLLTLSNTYNVDVMVENAYGDSTTGRLTLTPINTRVMISGSIAYADNTLVDFGSERTLTADTSSLIVGTGLISYAIVSGGRGGITINNATGAVTFESSLALGDYDLTVSVTSTHGGNSRFSFTTRVINPVIGTFSYTPPAATNVLVQLPIVSLGSQPITRIDADLSNLRHYTGFSIAPSDPDVDIGGVSLDPTNQGQIIVSSKRLGRAEYTITARGETDATVSTTIVLENIIDIPLSFYETINTTDVITGINTRRRGSEQSTIEVSSGGSAAITAVSTVDDFIIDDDRNTTFGFSDVIYQHQYYDGIAGDDDIIFNLRDDIDPLIQIGGTSPADGTSNFIGSGEGSISLGTALDPDLLTEGVTYEVSVNVARGENVNVDLGYVVMLSDGRTSTTAGVTNPRYTGLSIPNASDVGSTVNGNIVIDAVKTSTFTYAGGDTTLALYFSAPTDTVLYVASIIIRPVSLDATSSTSN